MTLSQRDTRIAQILVAIMGALNALAGVALLFAPLWFFENIGNFPPYNRHYEGDLGAFILAIGVGLLFAARDPRRHSLIIAVGALGGLVHVANHLYDAAIEQAPLGHILADAGPLTLSALGLAVALRVARPRPG